MGISWWSVDSPRRGPALQKARLCHDVIFFNKVWNSIHCNLHSFSPFSSYLKGCFYEWFSPSVCLSVCPSVCPSVTLFWLCSHHCIIMKILEVITNDRSDVHAKGQGQRSRVKVTEVNTQLSRFRTISPVWIQMIWWNDAQSLMLLWRGALLFFKVIRHISRSHGSKISWLWPKLGVSECNSSLNSPMTTKWSTKLEVA